MIDPSEFLQALQTEILTRRRLAPSTCEKFAYLSQEARIAYASAMRYLGCNTVELPPTQAATVPEIDRIRAARLMLLSLYVDTGEPAWSSLMLDRLLEAVMGTPGGSVGDLLHALNLVLEESPQELAEPMRNFIKSLIIKSFTEHRASFEGADLAWMVQQTTVDSTSAQAYLAMHAIPPASMVPRCAVTILRKLVYSPCWQEAIDTLSDDVNNAEAKSLVRDWLVEEKLAPPYAEDVKRIAGLV